MFELCLEKNQENQCLKLFFFNRDQSNEQALSNFLDHVRRVDLYGVDLHSVKVVLIHIYFQIEAAASNQLFWSSIGL